MIRRVRRPYQDAGRIRQADLGQYVGGAVSARRVEQGRAVAGQYRVLARQGAKANSASIRSVIVGIWGLETDFGGFAGSDNVIRALATLAYAHYRGDFFKDELLNALQILEDGDIAPAQMKGSWAGAMGQTQFMPSSFSEFAVDFDGDGRRNIWTSAPDAIGSTANYLAKHGWIPGQPWGFEVILPDDFRSDRRRFLALRPVQRFCRARRQARRRQAFAALGRR